MTETRPDIFLLDVESGVRLNLDSMLNEARKEERERAFAAIEALRKPHHTECKSHMPDDDAYCDCFAGHWNDAINAARAIVAGPDVGGGTDA